MSWRDDDETESFEVTLRRVSRNAALLEHDGDEQWVPHSLIRGGDLDCEDVDNIDESGTVEIAAWKAEEMGWA